MSAVVVEERVQQLAIKALVASPKNPRGVVGDVTELAESIKAQGIVEPLIVVQLHVQPEETYRVVAGHRRLVAARLAGLKTVPALVRQLGEREQLMTMLVENLQRQDLAPLQEARGYQELASLEYSQREIARQVGKSQSHVAKRLALLKLTPAATSKFESGGISAEDAVTLAAAPAAVQAEVLTEKYSYGSMAARIRYAEQRLEEAKKPKPKPPAAHAAAEAKYQAESDRRAARARAEQKLRNEAKAARLKVMPKVLSRGERELQYAAAVIVQAASFYGARLACQILGITATKPKRKYASIDYRAPLAKRAAASKVKAVEVLLALALGFGEAMVSNQWAGASTTTRGHLALLKKAGYRPNAIDRKLLRGGRR